MSKRALKPGWRWVRFGDVVQQVKDRLDPETSGLERYVAGEHMDTDDLRIRRWGTIGDGYLGPAFHMRFREGQVLYGSRRTYLRKVAVADFEGVCANTTFVLEPRGGDLRPDFLPFLMQSDAFVEHSVKQSRGSVNPYVNYSDLAWFEFALPAVDEQEAVANLLSGATETVDRLAEAAERCRTVKRAAMEQLLSRGVAKGPLVDTPLGPLPASWEVAPLDAHYSVQLGKMMSEGARGGEGAIPYMRNANVQWNRLELSDVATMAFTLAEREKFSLRFGDILACEGRHVGKSAMWRDEIPGACYQKALHRLRRRDDQQVPEFLLHCLQFYHWTGRFRAVTGETTIPHLPAERFRAMLFPFPPRGEQEEIVGAIAAIDDALAGIQHRRDMAKRSREELLREALSGETA